MIISNPMSKNFEIPHSYLYFFVDQKSKGCSDHEIWRNFWSGTSDASWNFIFYKFQKIWKYFRAVVMWIRFCITSDLQIDLKCYAESIFESYKAFFKWFLFAILRSILHLVSSVTFRNIVNALIFCGSIMLCQLKVYGWSRKLTERAVWRLFILVERGQRYQMVFENEKINARFPSLKYVRFSLTNNYE